MVLNDCIPRPHDGREKKTHHNKKRLFGHEDQLQLAQLAVRHGTSNGTTMAGAGWLSQWLATQNHQHVGLKIGYTPSLGQLHRF